MARVIIVDLLTGRRVTDIPFVSYSWARRRNQPEELSCVAPLADPDVAALGLRNAATRGKTALAIIEDTNGAKWFAGAGPMNKPAYDRDGGLKLTLTASGVISYFDDRYVLPPVAGTISESQFIVPDPLDATKTIPNPVVGTTFTGWSLGTLLKKVIQQALAWTGGNLPVVLPADIVGVHTQTWDGISFKPVRAAAEDISRRQGGPDFRMDGRFIPSELGIEWVLRTGTDTQPVIRSESIHRWDITAPESNVRGFKVDPDPTPFGSISWATGGRSVDQALVARVTDPTLTDAGFPLREILDSSHTDVSEISKLRSYATDNSLASQRSPEIWTFQVRKDSAPFIGEYDVGDRCDVRVVGDPYIPDTATGWHRREISNLAGDEGMWVTVTTVEASD